MKSEGKRQTYKEALGSFCVWGRCLATDALPALKVHVGGHEFACKESHSVTMI